MTERERENRKRVKRAFYNYEANRRDYLEKFSDVVGAGLTASYEGERISGGSGGLDARLAKLADFPPYRWSLVVERVMADMAESGKDKFVEDKFFRRKSSFFLQSKYYISDRTIRSWVEEVLRYATIIATEMRLITLIG